MMSSTGLRGLKSLHQLFALSGFSTRSSVLVRPQRLCSLSRLSSTMAKRKDLSSRRSDSGRSRRNSDQRTMSNTAFRKRQNSWFDTSGEDECNEIYGFKKEKNTKRHGSVGLKEREDVSGNSREFSKFFESDVESESENERSDFSGDARDSNEYLKENLSQNAQLHNKTRVDANSESYLSQTKFDQFPISPLTLKATKDAGYTSMTVVQAETLPVILEGKDVLAKAKTGTGKTIAFMLPAVEIILKSPSVKKYENRYPILVVVVCPTRELAIQAAKEANTLLKYHTNIGTQVVIGGTSISTEQRRLQRDPCQILVSTPGRLLDHVQNTPGFSDRLKSVKILVLDEADRLLDMGFRRDIERIIRSVPKERQTLLFSATVPNEIQEVCQIALRRDHKFINTVTEGTEETHAKVSQSSIIAPLEEQFQILYLVLQDHIQNDPNYKVLVFCTTAMVTALVHQLLAELKLNVRVIHSRKSQSYRTKVSDEFRKSKGLILVSSDVSARGVDYPDVTLVIQLGLPSEREQYIHRLGRTGRKGKEGEGILLLAPWEEFFLHTLKDLPIKKIAAPSIDDGLKRKVQRALFQVGMKEKESAYQSWLGYYNSVKMIGGNKSRLVELANDFSYSMGLDRPPAIPKKVLSKMGLANVPGLRKI
eukprot:TRINITY_DN40064_c0_g1_i1.p1 TRINITY_DN40064_c0_g1~~TRINITY_DN40064_c0_g1_i1.p1  ORF type:complete len:650 (+),score=117.42 TRINITY_DN40064_c0_g1_i1:134-2083(+)